MKRVFVTLTSTLLCLSAAMSGRAFAATADVKPATTSADQERIHRIENGLLPGILIKGQTIHGMNLIDRMKHYNVPGVSIAFFAQGMILWTRAYGYADVSRMKAVTPETLFQAASISKPISALAALRMIQDGKLNLDEDVNVKLKGRKVPEHERTEGHTAPHSEPQRGLNCRRVSWISRRRAITEDHPNSRRRKAGQHAARASRYRPWNDLEVFGRRVHGHAVAPYRSHG